MRSWLRKANLLVHGKLCVALILAALARRIRQLQKLEYLGLIEKNVYGSYVTREKASVSGHVWVGRNLVPRFLCYSFFFIGILSVEVAILLIQYFSQGQTPSLAVLYLVPITAGSAGLFLAEGLLLLKRNKPDSSVKPELLDEKI